MGRAQGASLVAVSSQTRRTGARIGGQPDDANGDYNLYLNTVGYLTDLQRELGNASTYRQSSRALALAAGSLSDLTERLPGGREHDACCRASRKLRILRTSLIEDRQSASWRSEEAELLAKRILTDLGEGVARTLLDRLSAESM